MKWFWRLSMARSEKKISKYRQIFIMGFQCVAKNIKESLKMCTLYLNYSQIWLNLLRDDRHFFYTFLRMLVTLALNKSS